MPMSHPQRIGKIATAISRLLAILAFSIFSDHAIGTEDSKSAPKAKYVEIQVEQGGTLSGRVIFSGEPPKLTLAVNQDRSHCSHDETGMRPSPRLSVSPNGGVRNAVVFIKDIGKGKPLADLPRHPRLTQKDCTYEPFVQVIPFKEKLVIANEDPLNHNVHAKLDDRTLFNFAQPNVGEMSKAVTWPGIISVNCDVHMWMNAYVISVRHPYYCVTDEHGVYTLTEVPPGDYELIAWHPGWNAQAVTNADGLVTGYKYDDPVTRVAKIKLTTGETIETNFTINE